MTRAPNDDDTIRVEIAIEEEPRGKATKMRWMKVIAVLSWVGLLAGCGQRYWYQEGKTFAECRSDRAVCRKELLKRTDLQRIGDYERRFVEDCMQAKGYRLVTEGELPLDVRREDSDIPSEVPWARGYGVAGTVE
jgi:hypothetical protein